MAARDFRGVALSTSTTLTYHVGPTAESEVELRPSQKLVFHLPAGYQSRFLRNIILVHRKDAKYVGSVVKDGDGYWDNEGAYSMVRVGASTGKWFEYPSAKFAEPRHPSEPEHECLHDLQDIFGSAFCKMKKPQVLIHLLPRHGQSCSDRGGKRQ